VALAIRNNEMRLRRTALAQRLAEAIPANGNDVHLVTE
jgi:hypothetical protein